MNFWLYFWLFLKASLFSTGGLGNLPFLHTDLIRLSWATEEDFLTAIAVGQLSPGPSGIWSVSLGYLTWGWLGAAAALVALSLPTLLIIPLESLYQRMEHLSGVRNFSRGLTLAVAGLSFYIAFILGQNALTNWIQGGIALAGLGLALTRKVPVVVILGAAAAAGMLLFR